MKRQGGLRIAARALLMLGLALTAVSVGACGEVSPASGTPRWAHVAPEQIAEAKKHGVPVAFENELGMRFVLIPAGTFLMGSPEDEQGREDDETQHEVTISEPFYMSICEVTNRQYRLFDPAHRSKSFYDLDLSGATQPVVTDHPGARHFATYASMRNPSRAYRLPKAVEVAYGATGGTGRPCWWGEDAGDAQRAENLGDESYVRHASSMVRDDYEDYFKFDDGHAGSAPVGSFPSNPWGLYDVVGNLIEWCADTRPLREVDSLGQARHEVATWGCSFESDRPALAAVRESGAVWTTPGPVTWGPIGFRLVSPLPQPGER